MGEKNSTAIEKRALDDLEQEQSSDRFFVFLYVAGTYLLTFAVLFISDKEREVDIYP